MTNFPGADRTAQWFQDNYPGSAMHPNVTVVHTTETTDWPGYSGGAVAPNLTAHPIIGGKRIAVREHFPLDRSSRALQNHAGGVETNTLNAIQIELVGTCDPQHEHSWQGRGKLKAGEDYIYWPTAPEWALRELGEILATIHRLFPAMPLKSGLKWLPYPTSYGSRNGQRMSNSQWRNFYGVCGHQHVPENDHGDPGNLPIEKVLAYAKGTTATAPAPAPAKASAPNRIERAQAEYVQNHQINVTLLDDAVKGGRVGAVKDVRDGLEREIARLHKVPGSTGTTRIARVLQRFHSERVIDLNILSAAVQSGRTGTVLDVYRNLRELMTHLPKR